MTTSPYRVTPARIGNSSGLRLPAAFYRDHPGSPAPPADWRLPSEKRKRILHKILALVRHERIDCWVVFSASAFARVARQG